MKLVGTKTSRSFLTLSAAIVLCFVGLSILEHLRGLSARVASCEIENGEAVITVHYKNRLNTAVRASFDLCLTTDGGPPNSSGGTIGDEVKILKRQHVIDLTIKSNEEKDRVWRMEIPSSRRLVSATVDRLSYKKVTSVPE
jgi:hypothetical protein